MIPAAVLFPIYLVNEHDEQSNTVLGNIRCEDHIRPVPDSARVLLTIRTHHVAHHRGQIAFPGGRIDDIDNSALETALRETEEEIGLDRKHIEIIQKLTPVPIVRTGFQVYPFIGLISKNAALELNPHEIESVFYVPLKHFLDPTHSKLETIEHGGLRYQIKAYYFNEHRIWGATALMIEQFFKQYWLEV